MSTAPRRKKPVPTPRASSSKPFLSGNGKHALVAVALVVFAGIPFVLGKYFELKQPDPFDSGSYVYSAQHVLSGARVGYEEKPSAQAGTLLVNMLGVALTGYNETGSKVLQGLFQAGALVFMFVTIRRLYGSLAAVISVIVAAVYLSAPVIAKFGNVKEQFMIALMVMGICSFVWYGLTGKWWWALLTGALLIGGPMFKQTGVSAIAAVGLFVLAGPILYRYAWKKVGKDILLLVAGAAITLTPICVWYASMGTPVYYWPYSFALGPVLKLAGVDFRYVADTGKTQESANQVDKEGVEGGTPSTRGQDARDTQGRDALATQDNSLILRLLPGYVSDSWRMLGPAERKEALRRVFRYYGVLILPISLALGVILARIMVRVRHRRAGPRAAEEDPGRFVLLFGLWWFFDMGFCFISPHSYEQYYLPLNASSAMLGGYFVGLYAHRFQADPDKTRWIVLGLLGLLVMIAMSWHIFFGLSRWPHSGTPAANGRIKGYVQTWQEVRGDNKYAWAVIGDYIRKNSQPSDPIYVWGWFPGIYVQAQRMSPTPKAFEGMMHTLPPEQLAERVAEIVAAFEKNPPKFIVDARKRHFPWTVPPLELWPKDLWAPLEKGFVPALEGPVRQYEQRYANDLRKKLDPVEAHRYEVMQPLRWYVMKNYKVVSDVGGQYLFRRK